MRKRQWFGVSGMLMSALSAGAFNTGHHAVAMALLAIAFAMLQVLKKWKPKH